MTYSKQAMSGALKNVEPKNRENARLIFRLFGFLADTNTDHLKEGFSFPSTRKAVKNVKIRKAAKTPFYLVEGMENDDRDERTDDKSDFNEYIERDGE